MKTYKIISLVLFSWFVLTIPKESYGKSSGFLPIRVYPPILVQNFDTCKISCGENVNVFVNNICIYELTPSEVLGECFALFQGYIIVYDGVRMTKISGGVIDRLGVFPFTIYNAMGGLVCLGQVRALDTIGPVFKDDVAKRDWESKDTFILSEKDIASVLNNEITWNQPQNERFLGIPSVKDGCNPNFIDRKVYDEITYFPCDSLVKFSDGKLYPNLIGKIKRTFIFTDGSRNESAFIQEIFFKRIGNASECGNSESLSFDYAPQNIYSFGPLGDNLRIRNHPNFPKGKTDLITTTYKCDAPDEIKFDVCSISDSLELDRIVRSVYSAFYAWPNGFKDTISVFDQQNLWKVSYKTRIYSECNDGKRVRVILTIEDLCTKKIISDTLFIYFKRTTGPDFIPIDTTFGKIILGRNPSNPIQIPLSLNACKASIQLPLTHGTNEGDIGKWFNWTVRDDCTPRANLLLSYQIESKVIPILGKLKSTTNWNKVNYPIKNSGLGLIINDIPSGAHRIIIGASAGECEAVNYDTLYFVFQDLVFPRARCKQSITIPLLYSGNAEWYSDGRTTNVSAKLRTDMVNNGSTDNCALDTMFLRRAVSESCIVTNFLSNLDYDKFGNQDGKVSLADFERITSGKNSGLYYTPRFMPYVEYFCCDIDNTNIAEFWVGDVGNGNSANYSFCEVVVTLEELLDPVVFSPNLNVEPNRTAKNWLTCSDTAAFRILKDEYKSNIIFGKPEIFGLDCTGKVSYTTSDHLKFGSGYITRHWMVEKKVKNIPVIVRDSQQIFVLPSRKFTFNIPADTTAFCGGSASQTFTFNSDACDLFKVSFKDSLISKTNSKNQCLTIKRTYTIVNQLDIPSSINCQEVALNPEKFARTIPRKLNVNGNAIPFVLSISKLNAEKKRIISDDYVPVYDATTVFSGNTTLSLTNVSLDEFPVENLLACKDDQIFAWKYVQILTLSDTTKPVITVPNTPIIIESNSDCKLPVSLSLAVSDNCLFSNPSLDSIFLIQKNTQTFIPWDGKIDSSSYENGILTARLHSIPVGNYDLLVMVSDNCGQKAQAKLPISVVASKILQLDLVENLTKNFDYDSIQGGIVKLTISDVLKDKSLTSKLTYCSFGSFFSIKRSTEASVLDTPKIADSVLVFSCVDFKNQPISIKVFLVDHTGNSISSSVLLTLKDSLNTCSPKVSLTGYVETAVSKPLRNVEMNINSLISSNVLTDTSGFFQIKNLTPGFPYILTPVSPNDYKNGVSTLDLVFLQRQILQGTQLKNPYQLIAADIDNSGTISVRDILELRKLVIGLTPKFEKNKSWRFIPKDFKFPNPSNPWSTIFPESSTFSPLSKDSNASFIAVKIGDLSGDAPVDPISGVQIRTQSDFWPIYYNQESDGVNGEQLISFYFKNLPDGFQTSISWKNLEGTVTFVPGTLNEENIYLISDRATLNVSSEKLIGDGPLFSLIFKSNDFNPKDFTFSSMGLKPEAYQGMQIFPLKLIEMKKMEESIRFLPASPNPFSNKTNLSFHLPKSTKVEIVVTDLSGRIVKILSGEGFKGLNTWSLDISEVNEGNMLICKMKADGMEAIQQIIKIKNE